MENENSKLKLEYDNSKKELMELYTDSNIQKEKDELIKYMELKENEKEK